jgi:hypothetical protein
MAVLCEGISVIVRRDAIDKDFDGGWSGFEALVPNSTLCTDGELARVGLAVRRVAQPAVHVCCK